MVLNCHTHCCYLSVVFTNSLFLLLKYNVRKFDEDCDDDVYKERHRIPREAVNFLEEKLHDKLSYKSHRNQPLTPRQQVWLFYLELKYVMLKIELGVHGNVWFTYTRQKVWISKMYRLIVEIEIFKIWPKQA